MLIKHKGDSNVHTDIPKQREQDGKIFKKYYRRKFVWTKEIPEDTMKKINGLNMA